MSAAIEGKLVRTKGGIAGRVYAVSLGEYNAETQHGVPQRVCGFVGLLKLEDGSLTTIPLEGATFVAEAEPKPVPMPVAPGGRPR